MRKEFKVKLEGIGKGASWTILKVPFSVEKVFGTRARVPVRGTINGFAFRSTLFPMGGSAHTLMVNKAMCAGAKCAPGDTVKVVMELDTTPRVVKTPPDLQKALAKNKAARERWDGLSYTHRREFANWITGAKQPETRDRRLAKTLEMLVAGKNIS